jgi:hypothetical protein
MSWPKTKGLRLYLQRKDKSYLLVDLDQQCLDGSYECIGETLVDNDPKKPMLSSSSCSSLFLYKKCRRVSWSDMPRVWKGALRKYIVGSPKKHRGLWRMQEI